MEKTYQPQDIEKNWYQQWENQGFFKPSGQGEAYCIMIPPPNVTGSLHMGHAFQDTIMDCLIRYQRMTGKNTLWQAGTDHAGIATQMVVERNLADLEGISRHEIGREAFIDKIWQWKEESGGTITRQLRRMGSSIDWSRERFTMDEGFYRAVQEVFIQLYDENLIYRGKRLVNWDCKFRSAISDLEVENREQSGHLWHFRYPLTEGRLTQAGKNYITVATTRPETILGDSAVAVHPDDPRYQDLIGQFVELPLVGRKIPIIADTYVDPEFGSGCVKITPAHDFNDYDVGKRHALPLINILTQEGTIRDRAQIFHTDGNPDTQLDDRLPSAFHQLDRFAAREKIIADFEALGLLDHIDAHTLKVPYGDRSGVVIEPLLTDQWFVAVAELAKPAIEAVENGAIEFVPKQYENMYFAWMRDIQDWCISRQLWWGHRIPAWYDELGNVYVGRSEQAVREKYQLDVQLTLQQDEDVLDTWFSSGLWTFGTLGWPENTPELNTFHPSSVLVTGFDIIFFWVARMIMLTLKFTQQVPFKQVYVHGLVRDQDGQKMSKSKGNVLDPLDLIDGIDLDALLHKRTHNMMQPQKAKAIAAQTRAHFPDGIAAYGTDALRFTFLSLASTGRDIKFDMQRMEGYRNFCNKLWNASRYVLMNTEGQDCGNQDDPIELSLADRWIISRLQQTEELAARYFAEFRFDLLSSCLYEFIWNEYCDWYLELSKPVLWDANASAASLRGTRRTLVRVLEVILRLAHPLMPYITEELWQKIAPLAGRQGPSIMLQDYPIANPGNVDPQAVEDIEWLKAVILCIRSIRSEMNLSPATHIPLLLCNTSADDERKVHSMQQLLSKMAKIDSINLITAQDAPMSTTGLVGDLQLMVPMQGLIDKESELKRLNKEIDKLNQDIQRLTTKLSNDKFINKAPAEVVAKERDKLQDMRSAQEKLTIQKCRFEAL